MLSYRFNGHRSKPLTCTTNPLLLLVLKVVMKDTRPWWNIKTSRQRTWISRANAPLLLRYSPAFLGCAARIVSLFQLLETLLTIFHSYFSSLSSDLILYTRISPALPQ